MLRLPLNRLELRFIANDDKEAGVVITLHSTDGMIITLEEIAITDTHLDIHLPTEIQEPDSTDNLDDTEKIEKIPSSPKHTKN